MEEFYGFKGGHKKDKAGEFQPAPETKDFMKNITKEVGDLKNLLIEHLENKEVPWTTFVWAMGIVLVVIGGLSSWVNSISNNAQAAVETAKTVDVRTTAQFDEILRSLTRIEKSSPSSYKETSRQ